MKIVPFEAYLILSLLLFGLGVFGMVVRRNLVAILMSTELALNAVNIAFVGADSTWDWWTVRFLPSSS
jgi:NADH dehydrogenase subunit K (EC 1.6.5.3)